MDQNSVYYKVFRVVCYFLMALLVLFGADKYYTAMEFSPLVKVIAALVITILLAVTDLTKKD